MPTPEQIVRVFVVGGEHAAAVQLGLNQGKKRIEIVRGGTFPDHDELSAPELVHGVLQIAAFVIGVYPGSNICVQVGSGQRRRMAVDFFVMALCSKNFFENLAIPVQDTGIIHHFREAEHPRMRIKHVDVPVRKRGTRFIQRGGGNAGGEHEEYG